jgi:uncharacterized protein YciI
MKHFIVEFIYKAPLKRVLKTTPRHREYLQTGYIQNILLMSGPQELRVGGILVAKSDDLEKVKKFCANDPYALEGWADYRFIQFEPKSFQAVIKNWIEAE